MSFLTRQITALFDMWPNSGPGDADPTRVRRPGFGLSVSDMPADHFPTAIADWEAHPLTVREICMLSMMSQLTDKPDWHRKVFDEEIVARWKKEALENDWAAAGIEHGDFSAEMFDYSIKELRDKAPFFESTGMTVILDTDACVVKSDSAVTSSTKAALKKAVESLENVPEAEKDWHPGTDRKVLDLVHPSLWPLVYGRSRVLANGEVPLSECLESCGKGDIVPVPPEGGSSGDTATWSHRFQWLPCDVEFADGDNAKIISYVNNLHPQWNADMYPVLEQLITAAVPLWHIVWKKTTKKDLRQRVTCNMIHRGCAIPDICGDYCHQDGRPLDAGETEDNRSYERDEAWFKENHPVVRPEPKAYEPVDVHFSADEVAAEGGLLEAAGKKLQVIVKLANIHLTPDQPTYDGGSWHIEGQLNEHICATAIYYYDSENITESSLAFRTKVDADELQDGGFYYEQYDFSGIDQVFMAMVDEPAIQDRGSVVTREDRLIAFPNVFQHAVAQFRLADPSRPGHRKIVALFLVDPAIRVLSTANVPPQQREWWVDRIAPSGRLGKLPPELTDAVVSGVDDFPIGLEEAKALRTELMAERTRISREVDSQISQVQWNFCEH